MNTSTSIIVFDHTENDSSLDQWARVINGYIKIGYKVEGMTSTENQTIILLVRRE